MVLLDCIRLPGARVRPPEGWVRPPESWVSRPPGGCLGHLGRVKYPEARSGLLEIQFSPFVAS